LKSAQKQTYAQTELLGNKATLTYICVNGKTGDFNYETLITEITLKLVRKKNKLMILRNHMEILPHDDYETCLPRKQGNPDEDSGENVQTTFNRSKTKCNSNVERDHH